MANFQVRIGKEQCIDCPGELEEAIRVWREKLDTHPKEEIHIVRAK